MFDEVLAEVGGVKSKPNASILPEKSTSENDVLVKLFGEDLASQI